MLEIANMKLKYEDMLEDKNQRIFRLESKCKKFITSMSKSRNSVSKENLNQYE